MKFRIHVPGISERVITGTYEDAIEAFEEALWEARLLPDEESLTAADMGLAGGVFLEDVLETQGFLTFAPNTYVERRETMKFRIHVPGISDREITGTYEDAIEAFEEALWEAQLLPDEESLSATDHLGLAGGVYPEDVLGLQGFLTFAPDTYVEVIREEA